MPFCALRLRGPRPHELATSYPGRLERIADHIRKIRLDRRITQRRAARTLGILPTTLCDWERHRTQPRVFHFPAIVRFLGYNPLASSDSLSVRLRAARWALGLSHVKLATLLGLDVRTIIRVELGRRPKTRSRNVLERFLADPT